MNRQTLEVAAGAPPGTPIAAPPGDLRRGRVRGWQAVVRVLRSPHSIARTLLDDAATTVFPAECRVCAAPILRAASTPVCDACIDGIAPQPGTLCGRCGEALGIHLDLEDTRFLGMLPEGILCAPCRRLPPDFARAVAFGLYEDSLREMVHLLKYERVRTIARPLGQMLAQTIRTLEPLASRDLLVAAVPLFPARETQRGYNQSRLIADSALAVLRRSNPAWNLTPAHSILRRTRNTESQYVLSPRGRRANLKGAFQPSPEANILNREILLIDDIYTTGATARECARVLRRAGAAKVWVATLARAQVERAQPQPQQEASNVAFWN